MSGIVETQTVVLGCPPHEIIATFSLTGEGTIIVNLSQDDGSEPMDIDGLFLNLTDDTELSTLTIFPDENTPPITGYDTAPDSVDTLDNGAQVQDGFDAGIQFGHTPGSTGGEVTEVSFTLYADPGLLSLDDIDYSSLAAVVNSDGDNGKALLAQPEDFEPGGDDLPDTTAFVVEGAVNVEVILSELENGDMQVDLTVLDGDDGTGEVGDLRGFFFNVANDDLVEGLSVTGDDITGYDFEAGDVSNLGRGNNMNGEADAFDGGVSIGRQGIGKGDDIQSTTFTLSHADGLSLADFSEELIGIRLTSTGDPDGPRDGSLKLVGEVPPQVPECPYIEDIDYVEPWLPVIDPIEAPDDQVPWEGDMEDVYV